MELLQPTFAKHNLTAIQCEKCPTLPIGQFENLPLITTIPISLTTLTEALISLDQYCQTVKTDTVYYYLTDSCLYLLTEVDSILYKAMNKPLTVVDINRAESIVYLTDKTVLYAYIKDKCYNHKIDICIDTSEFRLSTAVNTKLSSLYTVVDDIVECVKKEYALLYELIPVEDITKCPKVMIHYTSNRIGWYLKGYKDVKIDEFELILRNKGVYVEYCSSDNYNYYLPFQFNINQIRQNISKLTKWENIYYTVRNDQIEWNCEYIYSGY